ncbi:hypothetical protein F53441_9428 [Fusarium austroafricanum]|uniref:Uncharacterized protein n=1 Tax=Fusarium austroafricanum TaxID=2364996 RepID=A0A8H4P3E5_9HYPO|nr:hypothetical protein F53441_9428 [Fusarium austroafricanum]
MSDDYFQDAFEQIYEPQNSDADNMTRDPLKTPQELANEGNELATGPELVWRLVDESTASAEVEKDMCQVMSDLKFGKEGKINDTSCVDDLKAAVCELSIKLLKVDREMIEMKSQWQVRVTDLEAKVNELTTESNKGKAQVEDLHAQMWSHPEAEVNDNVMRNETTKYKLDAQACDIQTKTTDEQRNAESEVAWLKTTDNDAMIEKDKSDEQWKAQVYELQAKLGEVTIERQNADARAEHWRTHILQDLHPKLNKTKEKAQATKLNLEAQVAELKEKLERAEKRQQEDDICRKRLLEKILKLHIEAVDAEVKLGKATKDLLTAREQKKMAETRMEYWQTYATNDLRPHADGLETKLKKAQKDLERVTEEGSEARNRADNLQKRITDELEPRIKCLTERRKTCKKGTERPQRGL